VSPTDHLGGAGAGSGPRAAQIGRHRPGRGVARLRQHAARTRRSALRDLEHPMCWARISSRITSPLASADTEHFGPYRARRKDAVRTIVDTVGEGRGASAVVDATRPYSAFRSSREPTQRCSRTLGGSCPPVRITKCWQSGAAGCSEKTFGCHRRASHEGRRLGRGTRGPSRIGRCSPPSRRQGSVEFGTHLQPPSPSRRSAQRSRGQGGVPAAKRGRTTLTPTSSSTQSAKKGEQ
jgi:hypothetical protein